jgi:hypothetical protein
VDHLGISNTVDSTAAFNFAGVATVDVSNFFRFLSLAQENTTEKIGYKIFDLSVVMVCTPQGLFIVIVSKDCLFMHMRQQCILYYITYCKQASFYDFPTCRPATLLECYSLQEDACCPQNSHATKIFFPIQLKTTHCDALKVKITKFIFKRWFYEFYLFCFCECY